MLRSKKLQMRLSSATLSDLTLHVHWDRVARLVQVKTFEKNIYKMLTQS